jgi:hypothetical protein
LFEHFAILNDPESSLCRRIKEEVVSRVKDGDKGKRKEIEGKKNGSVAIHDIIKL